jgi:hypothetical protein
MSKLKHMMTTMKKRANAESSKGWEKDLSRDSGIANRKYSHTRRKRNVKRDVLSQVLPTLRDCPIADRKKLFIKKLRFCCYIFDFNLEGMDSAEEGKFKELKRTTLLGMVYMYTQCL